MSREELAVLLHALGETADAVAASLRRAGCRGVRGDPVLCPVAAYLRRHAVAYPLVWPDEALAQAWPPGGTVRCRTPRGVAAFLVRFDKARYPDLEGTLS